MQGGKPVEREPYVMQDVNGISYALQTVEVEKDLGVWMDNKFSDHVEHAVSKANQILGLTQRSFYVPWYTPIEAVIYHIG